MMQTENMLYKSCVLGVSYIIYIYIYNICVMSRCISALINYSQWKWPGLKWFHRLLNLVKSWWLSRTGVLQNDVSCEIPLHLHGAKLFLISVSSDVETNKQSGTEHEWGSFYFLHLAKLLQIIKGTIQQKMIICWILIHLQVIQNDHEFVSSWYQIWRNVSLHHLLINGYSAVNGRRQNESPNSW